jgi:hypothetical protein
MEEIRPGVKSQRNLVTQSNYPGPMREGVPEEFWFTTIFTLHRMCPRSRELYWGRDLFVKRKPSPAVYAAAAHDLDMGQVYVAM